MLKKSYNIKFFIFGNYITWPPKFNGINMRFSRNKELDIWYITMLNTYVNKLAIRALLIRA